MPMVALVVDDDELVLRLVAQILERAGFDVLTAASVPDALLAVERAIHPLDIVITDIQMPGASGFVLADELAARHPQLPILFMSGGYGDDDPGVQAHLRPGRAFLEKPFTERSIMAKLTSLTRPPAAGLAQSAGK
jgi:two-component system, cell cycle sensor histidine kinase and response regulator CckA